MSAGNEWTGIKGHVGGWFLGSPFRRLAELTLFGNVKPKFLDILNLSGDEVVVDVGCGSGFYSIQVAERLDIGRLLCVDVSEEMLAHLRRKVLRLKLDRRVDIHTGGATDLPLEDGIADLAISTALFHELEQPERAMDELTRVLKPGGRVVIADFRATDFFEQRIKHVHGEASHGAWNEEDISQLFWRAGLTNVTVQPVRNWIIAAGHKPA